MQFLLLVYQNPEHFATVSDAEKLRVSNACNAWFEKLERDGHGRGMNRLNDIRTAATVRRSGEQVLVMDGPFAETRELLGGYVLVECRDREEACALAATFPGLEINLAVEVRPIMTTEEEQKPWRKR